MNSKVYVDPIDLQSGSGLYSEHNRGLVLYASSLGDDIFTVTAEKKYNSKDGIWPFVERGLFAVYGKEMKITHIDYRLMDKSWGRYYVRVILHA